MRPTHHVVRGQQHLANHKFSLGEGLGVAGDERPLTHARRGLLRRQILRPHPQPQGTHRPRHRTGTDDHHLAAGVDGSGDHGDDRGNAGVVQPTFGCRQRGRSDLDHDAAGRGEHRAWHHSPRR